tara:strand:- start:3683 stop:3868 length:186 start_codon:yes stop_codon:yes gene_type:complete
VGIAARVALALARDARSRRMTRTNASYLCVVTSVARAPRVDVGVAEIIIIFNHRARDCRER